MEITVAAPGSCGELVQGTIDGQPFLVTCPIDVHNAVTVTDRHRRVAAGEKTVYAVTRVLRRQGVRTAVGITGSPSLPVGKGLASSSADVSAACQAAALYAGSLLSAHEIADIALSIEPTDGIFYEGCMLFDHVRGRVRRCLGMPPPLYIAVFDTGGAVDTLQFNQRRDLAEKNRAKEPLVRRALAMVEQGLATGDAACLGRGATMSAFANQSIIAKPSLTAIWAIARRWGAVGVNTAHSGTVIGGLFPPAARHNIPQCVAEIRDRCAGVTYWRSVKMISGGLVVRRIQL